MATGSPVSFWYGTRAQFDSITTKLDTTLYFITDEQALYKGTVKFSGSGVDTLLTISATEPTASSVTTGDKYFNTSDNLIHVLKNEDGTVTTTATYEPANGALYYNADAQRFQTLIKDGSSYVPTEIYDAGISVEDGTGLVLNGTTVGGLDATTNSKGVVQVGSNLNVSNGVISVPTATNARFGVVKSGDNITNNNGVISVAKATASSLGVVKPGNNINVDNNGQISVPVANGSTKGVVSAGENVNNNDGVLSVSTASTGSKGVIKIADPFSCDSSGILSIADASTSAKGVVKLMDDASSSDMDSQTKAITPHAVGQVADGLNQKINTKQDNLSNGNVTTLNTTDGAKIDVNVGDGLDVGVAGSTNANKLIVNEASVKEVLEDVVDGGTEPAVNEIVTADNLKGALSFGQAVDVACCPDMVPGTDEAPTTIQFTGDSTQYTRAELLAINDTSRFLKPFTFRYPNAGTANHAVGFAGNLKRFPKYAKGLLYLFIADVRNASTTKQLRTVAAAGYGDLKSHLGDSGGAVPGVPRSVSYVAAGDTTWHRVAVLFGSTTDASGGAFIQSKLTSDGLLEVEFANFRQYEVTALTDEAIMMLAAYGQELDPETGIPVGPDGFFRSTSAYSIRDKYLIKQDMVCPFIPTINMPDNSDLTVAAGLSYKIKYTNDNPHIITADTIPTDAYGWDTHIQMFIKGTSAINFQAPLVLMDALTPNAGHNMVVKWRNGDALVYVDDTNAGYIVVTASGTANGSLNFGIVDPGTDYVIFAASLDGTTVDAGTAVFGSTATTLTTLNILGNGTDATTITGTIGTTSGKTINLQSLTIDGGTVGGSGLQNLDDVVLVNATLGSGTRLNRVEIPAGSTVTGNWMRVPDGAVVTGAGLIDMSGMQTVRLIYSGAVTLSGVTVANAVESGVMTMTSAADVVSAANVTFQNNNNGSGSGGAVWNTHGSGIFTSCSFIGNSSVRGGAVAMNYGGYLAFSACTFSGNSASIVGQDISFGGGIIDVNSCEFTDITGSNGSAGGSPYVNLAGSNRISKCIRAATSTTYLNLNIESGAVVNLTGNTYTNALDARYGNIAVNGAMTVITSDGTSATLGAMNCGLITNAAKVSGDLSIALSADDPWEATNIIFASPLDATQADTIKLTGTAFTTTAKTINTNRIQLPASTTVSFQGNTNDSDTKILDAGLIVVGDNPASPSGSATVVNASGTSSTVTGIGTYIDKEGDNDFVANNTTNVKAVDASTTGAKYLGTVLSATTGDTGANRFAKIDSGAVAVVNEATNAVNKQIITHDYEPILGGTFSLTSATVDEATKTVAILEGGTMSIVNIRGGKDSVIDLGGTYCGMDNLATVSVSGCTLTGGYAPLTGGAILTGYTNDVQLVDVVLSGNSAAVRAGGFRTNIGSFTLSNTVVSGNKAGDGTAVGQDICMYRGGTMSLAGCTIGDLGLYDSTGSHACSAVLSGSNKVDFIRGVSNTSGGKVILTSGASINLTSSIAPGGTGGITVLTGGCTVNGNAIPAGTYTSIDSNGQPT